jgi:hypothetical protein
MCSSKGGILRALLLPALVHCCATLRTVGVVPKSYFVDAAYLPPPKMLDSSSLQVRQLVAARSPRVLSIWPLQGDSLVVDPVPDDAVLSAPSSDVVLDAEHSISVSFTLDAISGAQCSRARLGKGLRGSHLRADGWDQPQALARHPGLTNAFLVAESTQHTIWLFRLSTAAPRTVFARCNCSHSQSRRS